MQVILCKIPSGDFRLMYDVGQATRAHYATASLIRNPAGFPEAAAAASGAVSGSLNVLVEQRHGVVRNFLNMDQLLKDCGESGKLQGTSVACRSATFAGDLAWCVHHLELFCNM